MLIVITFFFAVLDLCSDSREYAFQQLQRVLAGKDMELAAYQEKFSSLMAEVEELRRVSRRESVNMDYLKNVILQYMTFPIQSAERVSLVPVIAMLLQFNPKEMQEVDKATRDPNSNTRPIKEIRRSLHNASLASSTASNATHPPSVGANNNKNSSNSNALLPSTASGLSYSPPLIPNGNRVSPKLGLDRPSNMLNISPTSRYHDETTSAVQFQSPSKDGSNGLFFHRDSISTSPMSVQPSALVMDPDKNEEIYQGSAVTYSTAHAWNQSATSPVSAGKGYASITL